MRQKLRAPIFWLVLAAMVSALLALGGLFEGAGATGRGLTTVHGALNWLMIEPIGLLGAIGLVMATGAFAAFLSWPRTEE